MCLSENSSAADGHQRLLSGHSWLLNGKTWVQIGPVNLNEVLNLNETDSSVIWDSLYLSHMPCEDKVREIWSIVKMPPSLSFSLPLTSTHHHQHHQLTLLGSILLSFSSDGSLCDVSAQSNSHQSVSPTYPSVDLNDHWMSGLLVRICWFLVMTILLQFMEGCNPEDSQPQNHKTSE